MPGKKMYGEDDLIGNIRLSEANPEGLIARVAMVGQPSGGKVHFYSAELDKWTSVDIDSSHYQFHACTSVALAVSDVSRTLGYSALTGRYDAAEVPNVASHMRAGNVALLRSAERYEAFGTASVDWNEIDLQRHQTAEAIHHNVVIATAGVMERLFGFSAYSGTWTAFPGGRIPAGTSLAGANLGMLRPLVRKCVWAYSAVTEQWSACDTPGLATDDPFRADTNVGLVATVADGRMYGFSALSGKWTPSEETFDPAAGGMQFSACGNLGMVQEPSALHLYSAIQDKWIRVPMYAASGDITALGVNADGRTYPSAGT